MKLKAYIANSIWRFATLPEYYRFRRSLVYPHQNQRKVLMRILRENQNCHFGKKYNFHGIKSIDEYQKNVPIGAYEDYEPYIEKLIHKKENLLTCEPIISLSLTSGTTSPSKCIPLTASLKRQFGKGISPWIHYLFKEYPNLKFYSSFWIITPNTQIPNQNSKIKIGFDDDSSYFNLAQRLILSNALCLPDWLSKIQDQNNFYYALSYFLLRERDVGFMSFWSPTLLPSILKFIVEKKQDLIRSIESGELTMVPNDKTKNHLFKPLKSRALELNQLIKNQVDETDWQTIWPNVEVLSSWTHGWSRELVDTCISKYFPDTPIQPKGLMATEYMASIPWKKQMHPVLCPTTHFFEFIDQDSDTVELMHQLKPKKKYEIVVTTGGGLYRYRTGDIIQVSDFIRNTPSVEFIGKREITIDLCGEKISQSHIEKAIDQLCEEFHLSPNEVYICPAQKGSRLWYNIIVAGNFQDVFGMKYEMEQSLDNILKHNYHYRHARNLGQLDAPEMIICEFRSLMNALYRGPMSTRKPISLISEINFQNKFFQYDHPLKFNS